MSERRTCLVYHIDEGLRVVFVEATDRAAHILAREDLLDQRGEFMRSERTPDQTRASWNIEVKKEGRIREASILWKNCEAGVNVNAYHSRTRRLLRFREERASSVC